MGVWVLRAKGGLDRTKVGSFANSGGSSVNAGKGASVNRRAGGAGALHLRPVELGGHWRVRGRGAGWWCFCEGDWSKAVER